MGKLMLLLVTVSTLVGMLLHSSTGENHSKAEERFNVHGSKVLAREIAMTGLNEALLTASAHFGSGSYTGPTSLAGSYEGGSYSITLEDSTGPSGEALVAIDVVSTFDVASTLEIEQYNIERVYEFVPGGGGYPPHMINPITCDGDINVGSDLLLSSYDPAMNSNIHANGSLAFNGGWSQTQGFGYYGSTIAFNNGQGEADIFMPNTNPSAAPLTEQVDVIEFPMFSASASAPIATTTTVGDLEMWDGFYMLGTEESPVIWFIDGDLTIPMSTFFSGFGTLVVSGDVHIQGDIYTDAAMESSLGIYSENDIHVEMPYLYVEGALFAGGASAIVFFGRCRTLWPRAWPQLWNVTEARAGTPAASSRFAAPRPATPGSAATVRRRTPSAGRSG